MRSERLFSGGELCLKILSQSTYLEKPILPDDKAAQKFFEQIHFPAYTQAEIKSMSTDLESGASVRDVLVNHSCGWISVFQSHGKQTFGISGYI